MSSDETRFLPYETAVSLVGAIQEEEHIHDANRRILTVYDRQNREICWFDYADTIAIAAPGTAKPKKELILEQVQDYILHHIPEWALD